jgi:hypothetical protein
MTSMPFDSKIMRLVIKSNPLMLRFSFRHNCLADISPPEELTIIWHLSGDMDRLYFSTYIADMKEWDAAKSNNTTVEVALTRNITRTTSGASRASSTTT